MGNGCCKQEVETNPDGNLKDPQTQEQVKEDPAELRRWAKDGETVELERLLKRMPVKAIRSGAKKSEGSPDEEGHTALHFAASVGSLPCVELLILYGAGVNARGAGGATPLHCALEGGRRDVAAFLLEHAADINAPNKEGASPFLSVLLSGRKRLAGWLLQQCGASLDVVATDKSGVGPCTVAARHGWWDLLEKLADLAADPTTALNTRSSLGETALGWVLKYGASGLLSGPDLERMVTMLLEKGASAVVPAFQEQIPPICLAAATGNAVVLTALRDRGARLDPAVSCDSVRRNPMHYAAAKGHVAMCQLLAQEAGPEAAPQLLAGDAAGNTPQHLAAVRGHGEVARVLLEAAPDVAQAIMATNSEGVSIYHLALQAGPGERAQQGALWMLERIGQEGSKEAIKAKERLLETPLLLAVGSHQEQVVAKLLAMGHDSNEANWAGETPISRCLSGATVSTATADGAIFKLLMEGGAKMENASASHHPLLAICMNPLSRLSEQVVELLVARAGGDAAALKWQDHADALGRGPLHLAALYDNAFMVRYLLEQAKVDVEVRSAGGVTPLMYAAMGSSTSAIKVLLNRRADPRATDSTSKSVLSYCLKLDRPESLACAAMLLVMGCPPDDCLDLRGEGLLHRAVRYGSSEFIRLWARYGGNLCLLATTDDAAPDLPEDVTQLLQLEQAQQQGAQGGGGGGGGGDGANAAAVAAAAAARRKRAEGDYLDAAPQTLEVEEAEEEGAAADLGSGKLPGADEVTGATGDGSAEGDTAADGGSGGFGSYYGGKGTASGNGRAGSGRNGSGGSGIRTGSNRVSGSGGLVWTGSKQRSAAGPENDGGLVASESGLARGDTGPGVAGGEAEPYLESFSVPTGAAYGNSGGGDLYGSGNGSYGKASSMSRAVAEALEAVEAEVDRFPSFCRRPSVLEVRRWARRGAAWFDDALPAVTHPDLGADGCPPSLPLPPGDEEELAEEEALQGAAAPAVHPALDTDAIWRRMLLERMKDRRPAAARAAAAAAARAHSTSASGIAESTLSYAYGGADARALRPAGSGQRRDSNSGSSGASGGCDARSTSSVSSASWRALGRANSRDYRRASSSGIGTGGGGSSSGYASQQFMRASSSGVPDVVPSAVAAPQAAAAAAGGSKEDWMEELVRAAEETLKQLQRGVPVSDGGAGAMAYGSGSRAVRAVAHSRRSLSSMPEVAAGGRVGAARPVAEAKEEGGISSSDDGGSDSPDSSDDEGDGGDGKAGSGGGGFATADGKLESTLEDAKGAAMGLASKLLDKQIAINDPYFKKGSRYKGVPRYLNDESVNVKPATRDELLALADELAGRLRRYGSPVDEPPLSGADLRERNILWYNKSLSPAEYPMKPGQWKAAIKKAKAAAKAARERKAGDKVVLRSRKVWFGLPAMPSRPELAGTSALVLAVRLCRPACVAALLAASLQPLNLPDGWGHTPTAYAAYMLARDKRNAALQQVYDMLLEKLPQVNHTRLSQDDGNTGHSLLCPINLAVISGDRSRLAHLVLRCAGAINNSWTALPEIPAYLQGTWEKLAGRCDSRCPPLALAVLSKRIDTVKLVLDLGADPNLFGEARDTKLKAKLAKEYAEEQELQRRLQDEYDGVLTKAKLGLMQRIARIKRAISNIEIPGLTKPHPFVTPLHLAARTGQAEVAFLLLRRGALANGGGAVPYAKKSPLQEALMYARSNFSTTFANRARKNWKEVRPSFEDLPPMSPEAVKKEADARGRELMRAMVDPTVMAIKAVALAAKYAVNFLLDMRKRPIAHWDPALWTAHVLFVFRAPYDLSDAQTSIVLRDLIDNGKWKWLRRPAGRKFAVLDSQWTEAARGGIQTLKTDLDIGYAPIATTGDPKQYKTLKQQFVARADEAYFGAGGEAMYRRYQKCSQALLQTQQQYMHDVMQPAVLELAEQAVRVHVQAASTLLELQAASRRQALEASAAALELGVALDEAGVMDCLPYGGRFTAPATVLPADAAAEVARTAQEAAVERLRALAERASSDESWGRVMVWGPGGAFVGVPGDRDLQALPTGEEEIKEMSRALAGLDTDKIKESLSNLTEQLNVTVDSLLAKMHDAQEGLSSLLEVIGIDFLDVL